MNDSISRQAAIDALNEGIEYIQRALDNMELVSDARSKFEFGRMLLEACIDTMKLLPSTEPEREYTMEEFMCGQDMGNPEDGSL